jgi:hypothetical protein
MKTDTIPAPPEGWEIVSKDDPRLDCLPCDPKVLFEGFSEWGESGYRKGDSVHLGERKTHVYAFPIEQPQAVDPKDGSPLARQEGGGHYKDCAIQPVEFITANKLNFLEGCVVKRICRHRRKNGAEDIRKAIHELELLLALEYPEGKTRHPSCPD